MKMRNKGKVHPSPSSSSSSSSSIPSLSVSRDASSVLKLLPTTILALASVLSIQDQEVLAYIITRSMKSENPYSTIEEKNKNSKKSNTHKPPVFDCECFDCYTSYWFRWDSSSNRELIHQAIEAFEEHLANGERSKKKKNNNRGNRKREKMGRRGSGKQADLPPEKESDGPEIEDSFVVVSVEDVSPVALPAVDEKAEEEAVEEEVPPGKVVVLQSPVATNDKGLARKVLPDVLGLFNSRLWNLWSPKA